MQLVEQKKINLDAEVRTYVPYFPKKEWPVTVRQLLGHIGGISHYKDEQKELHIKDHKTTREAIAIFEGFDLIAEPGTSYNYSSYGYNLLGATSMSTRDGRLTNYAMGWDTTPYGGRYMIAHSGGQQETSTLLYILPTRKMVMAIGMNFESSDPGVYLDRPIHYLTGAPFIVYLYSADRSKSSLADAINTTFNYGLSYFDRFQKPMTSDPGELAKAFAYFNDVVDLNKSKANPKEATKKIREGVHPVGQESFTKVGSYVAARLAEKHGAAKLDTYAALGGLATSRTPP
jgi:hypothetical protein